MSFRKSLELGKGERKGGREEEREGGRKERREREREREREDKRGRGSKREIEGWKIGE